MAKKKPGKIVTAVAFHEKSKDGTEVVGIGNLRVVIIEENGMWFAQGLEIDYAAQGHTLEDVKKQFEDGLCATIHEHLRVHGTIDKMLNAAPPTVWKEMLYDPSGLKKRYSQVSAHHNLNRFLPFENINYLQAQAV